MNPGSVVRGIAALTALFPLSCGAPATAAKGPPPERSAAPSAPAGPAPDPSARRMSFAALGGVLPAPEPGPRHFVAVYVDLSKSPGSPLLDAAAAALRASDHAIAKQEFAAALKKLDPVADFVPWLVAHTLWGRACNATGDSACAAREYEIVRSAWADPALAEQKARGDEADRGVQRLTLARAVAAVGEALYFFADKQRREKVEPIQLPAFKGVKSQETVARFFASDLLPWLKDKLIAINAAELEYKKIAMMLPGPSALWSIEGGAASGRMWAALAREIYRTPMPAEFKKPGREKDALDYRQSLDVTAFPVERRARTAFELCRDFAAKSAGHDEIAKECVDWLDKNPAPESPPEIPASLQRLVPADILKRTGPQSP